MHIQEWIWDQTDIRDKFNAFWREMNAHWPSSFPMDKDPIKWTIEFNRWISKGMPAFSPSGSSYFD